MPDVLDITMGGGPRRRVLLINTGGTMGMKPTPSGLAPSAGYLTERIACMEELRSEPMPRVDVLDFDPLLDSADFAPAEWVAIATAIERAYATYDGFVVVMGTDTLAYCASALAFMLEHLGKPVILTGSQIPLCDAFSDARRNLIVSLLLAAALASPRPFHNEVMVCFGEVLLRGCRATKLRALDLRAFGSPNLPPLARLGVRIELAAELARPPARRPLLVHTAMDTRVLVVRLVPGFDDSALKFLCAASGLRALVLEFYGVGSAPTRRAGLLEALAACRHNGVLVVAVTQCVKGAVRLGQYAVGAALLGAGVVSAGDMTTEAAATKLAFLFGLDRTAEGSGPESAARRSERTARVAALLQRDLRGELSEPAADYGREGGGVGGEAGPEPAGGDCAGVGVAADARALLLANRPSVPPRSSAGEAARPLDSHLSRCHRTTLLPSDDETTANSPPSLIVSARSRL